MRDESEVHGLLALMLLEDARRAARTDAGRYVPLDEQDRSRWDRGEAEGLAALRRATGAGPYQVQAAIAALELQDPIEWDRVADLYAALTRLAPVAGRRGAAGRRDVASRYGPAGGLRCCTPLRPTVRWPSTSRCTPPTPDCCAGPGRPAARRTRPQLR